MANIIKIPFSNTSGNTPASLVDGQIAINQASGSLFYRNSSGAVTQFTSAATLADGYVYDCGAYSSVAPSVPTSLSGVGGSGQVVLSWGVPVFPGGASITDYTVQYSSNSGSSYTTFSRSASTATTATVTGLTNGTAYIFRVSATSSAGTGSYSTASSSITPASSGPLLSITRIIGGSDASSFTLSGSTFTRTSGYYDDDINGLRSYKWTANASATVTVVFSFTDEFDGSGSAYIKKNGSTVHTVSQGTGITRTVSVASTDEITITSSKVDGNQWFINVSISAA
jgi:hypothetical protein